MTIGIISFLLLQGVALMLDRRVRPRLRSARSWQGFAFHALGITLAFGLFLAASGNAPVAAGLAAATMTLIVVVSNAKHAMLGEPLLFSDFALVAAVVRHPAFYLTAVSIRQKALIVAGAIVLIGALAWLFVPRVAPHVVGLTLSAGSFALLRALLGGGGGVSAGLAREPDVDADLRCHGLIATLLLYWRRWRETPDPPPCPPDVVAIDASRDREAPELVIVVQCESFADPAELTGDPRYALPGLARARASAWQWGDLNVSGFGAYTMRTEFGVLFGRSEEALGFRRYDPFLTASGEASYALSARLGTMGHHALFVHPHDLRFYGRDRLMPAIGFDRLIGEESFAPVAPGAGRYVDDRTVGASLRTLIDEATGRTLIYTVTMENHGPWMKDRLTGSPGGLDAYLHHVRSSDAMLSDLITHLQGAGRPSLLVFFGDHRPSIPGVLEPGHDRHTPYVIMRFDRDGATFTDADRPIDLTPDQLHHAILDATHIGARIATSDTHGTNV